MPAVPLIACLLSCCLLGGCFASRSEERPISAEEQSLIDYLCRDPGVRLAHVERRGEGDLLVTTRQGNGTRRYLIGPEIEGGEPVLRRVIEETVVPLTPSPRPGIPIGRDQR